MSRLIDYIQLTFELPSKPKKIFFLFRRTTKTNNELYETPTTLRRYYVNGKKTSSVLYK